MPGIGRTIATQKTTASQINKMYFNIGFFIQF